MCAKHHFEMVMNKPCPFTYEDMELYEKGAFRMKGWELIINSITTSIGKMLAYSALVLFGMLISALLTWLGLDDDDWFEGDWLSSGILGGTMMSFVIIVKILHPILFADARRSRIRRFSSGWASVIISIGIVCMGLGWLIATKIQWPELTSESSIPLTDIFGALVGLLIGLSIGLGAHEASRRVS
jgi:hypothetical protein